MHNDIQEENVSQNTGNERECDGIDDFVSPPLHLIQRADIFVPPEIKYERDRHRQGIDRQARDEQEQGRQPQRRRRDRREDERIVVSRMGIGDFGDALHDARLRWAPAARQDALLALARAIEAHGEEFAQLEMHDTGKPISNVRRVDVPQSAAGLRYFAGWATKLAGETMDLSVPGNWHACTLREPVGVVGQIIPWNYPLMGAAMKIGPALAAGCAVVLKPAELTSLSALRLADLLNECGVPPGMVNIVPGRGGEAGAALVDHPGVAKIAFTGSTMTGRQILRRAQDDNKDVFLHSQIRTALSVSLRRRLLLQKSSFR